MHAIEALGLLKFDFLGLSNLTILKNAVDTVKAHRGIDIDLDHIPLDDAATFELLASGETTGIFQLESAGMRRYVRDLRPTSVFDLAAMVALYRPGPMDNIPAYIRRKHGQEAVTYLHPLLEPFLERTYGIFVYQEDIMAAAIALGGFTGPEADTLGYAIRKKKSALLRSQKEKFVTQAAERGVAPNVIDAVFKAFEPFERYGFNKAHATCYGLIAYQTAYLKANYTVEYMTSVLSAFRSSEDKVAAAVAECRRLGIDVRPPDVHRSQLEFTVEGDAIRFGLLAIKNVGQGAIESIIAAREADGEFRTLTDFCTRIDLRLTNRKVLESLAKVGALNAFGHPAQILEGLDDAAAAAQATQRDRISGQTSLFDMGAAEAATLDRPLPATPEAPVRERLRWEKELLGLYLSEHPMGEVADRVGDFVTAYSGDLKSDETLDGQRLVLGGIVVGTRTVVTRARSTMAVVTIEDLQGSVEVVVFPKLYDQTAATWQEGSILLIAGRVDHRGEDVSLLADLVKPWDEAILDGPEAFARSVAAGDRGSFRRRQGGSGQGPGGPGADGHRNGNGNGSWSPRPAPGGAANGPAAAPARPPAVAVGPGGPGLPTRRADVPYVSPLRAGTADVTALPQIEPAEPISTYAPDPLADRAARERDDEPALPDEARAQEAAAASAETVPVEGAGIDRVLHVRFGGAPADQLVRAMETFRQLVRERPGETRVVVHVPAPGGSALPMELKQSVAYDPELLAEVQRRLGAGVAQISLA
jgi:DNA polymerase-3 subunit alpha